MINGENPIHEGIKFLYKMTETWNSFIAHVRWWGTMRELNYTIYPNEYNGIRILKMIKIICMKWDHDRTNSKQLNYTLSINDSMTRDYVI